MVKSRVLKEKVSNLLIKWRASKAQDKRKLLQLGYKVKVEFLGYKLKIKKFDRNFQGRAFKSSRKALQKLLKGLEKVFVLDFEE